MEGTALGVGFRHPHRDDLVAHRGVVSWAEALTDNYLYTEGAALDLLGQVRDKLPIALHGVGLSVGSADALDADYLRRLRDLVRTFEPLWVSDHLCWTRAGGRHLHELLPLPRTEEAVRRVAQRVREVQDVLGRRILLENASAYVEWRASAMTEVEFLEAVILESDCDLLLDVNNAFVTAHNIGRDARADLDRVIDGPLADRIRYVHLAGHQRQADVLIDTHSRVVADEVWALYGHLMSRVGPRPTLIEWDNDLPTFDVLVGEAARAGEIQASATGQRRPT